MVRINKVDYKTWEPEKVVVSDISAMDLYQLFKDVVYIVEKTEGRYIVHERVCDEDLAVLAEFAELTALQKNEGKKSRLQQKNEGISDKDCVNFEFVPISNMCIAYTAGRIYTKFIQYDYIALNDTESIKKAIKCGVVLDSGLCGLRCNKVYKEHTLWTYQDGWLVDTIELVKKTDNGSYKRVIVELSGTIISDIVDKDLLYCDYLRASYTTIRDIAFTDKDIYDKPYNRLKWRNKGLLKEYDVDFDKNTDMTTYSCNVKQIGLKTNDEVYDYICRRFPEKRGMEQRWECVDNYLTIGTTTKRERLMRFEFDMLNCMLSSDFRDEECAYFERTGHWFHKYDLGYGLNIIVNRDWFKYFDARHS